MVTKKEIDKREMISKKMQKLFSEIMRAIGFVFLFAFSMIGAIVFYTIQGTGNIIQTIMVASVVVIMLFAMTQVKDRW